jgi:hypothetical protein
MKTSARGVIGRELITQQVPIDPSQRAGHPRCIGKFGCFRETKTSPLELPGRHLI